ncbi:MAG: hypothetical protein ACXU86_06510 [Archangium sp.]
MKKAELASPLELEQRLKLGVDHLRQMRESMEELVRIADAIGPLLGVQRKPGRAKAAPRAAEVRTQGGPAAAPPPARRSQTPQGSEPSPPASPDEVPEWRRLFPELSAEVPGRVAEPKKKTGPAGR